MTAKMVGKPYRGSTRHDWDEVRVPLMAWCLRLKLGQHWSTFGDLLDSTRDRRIVEESARDPFWGARPVDDTRLEGRNVLGELLMELRAEMRAEERISFACIEPPSIGNPLLLGAPIAPVVTIESAPHSSPAPGAPRIKQPSLFYD
jgi:hypothetical protein